MSPTTMRRVTLAIGAMWCAQIVFCMVQRLYWLALVGVIGLAMAVWCYRQWRRM